MVNLGVSAILKTVCEVYDVIPFRTRVIKRVYQHAVITPKRFLRDSDHFGHMPHAAGHMQHAACTMRH